MVSNVTAIFAIFITDSYVTELLYIFYTFPEFHTFYSLLHFFYPPSIVVCGFNQCVISLMLGANSFTANVSLF